MIGINEAAMKATFFQKKVRDALKEKVAQATISFFKERGVAEVDLSYAERKNIHEWSEYAVNELSASVAELLNEKGKGDSS